MLGREHISPRLQDLIENNTVGVTSMGESCMAVELEVPEHESDETVEIYIGPTIEYSGCDCCGDMAKLTARYNRSEHHIVEKFGEPDPLGIKD